MFNEVFTSPKPPNPFLSYSLPQDSLGRMASRGTCTLDRDTSGPLAGLPPWREGWMGDKERNRGLPGAEPSIWALAWDTAGEPGMVPGSREAEGASPAMEVGTPIPIPNPPTVFIWTGKLAIKKHRKSTVCKIQLKHIKYTSRVVEVFPDIG